MNKLALGLVLLAAGNAAATPSLTHHWPSCDIKAQRDVKGEAEEEISDPLQAHISVRINVLQADLSNARKARFLTESQSDALWHRADHIRKDTDGYVNEQGFLSAAERASYDRELDDIAQQLCRTVR